MTPEQLQQLECEYASDLRRYQDEDIIEIYDTKGEYSHTEYLNQEETWKQNE